ncbi:MAG: glycerol acyltransferase [Chlorobi bacterium]|nr:glycerol acyltransferase [Chlorobiota bacterium]
MKEKIGKWILKLLGWKHQVPEVFKVKRAVMIGAPHTSNWDILYSLAGMWAAGYRPKFFIKKEWIDKPLIGSIIKWLGGIPVDRSKRNNLVQHSVDMLRKADELVLLVPVEGTRKRVDAWKKGFYYIALESELPLLLAYLDYKKKEAGVGRMIYLSGDFEKDMLEIENFYKNITAKHPENFNPHIFHRSNEHKTIPKG